MCGVMTWVSDYKLIGALGNAGGFGLLAGGIATGRMMAHLSMMGATGLQMGTRFVMSMAGQSVGLVNKIKPIQGIIDEIVNDAESELKRIDKIFMET